MPAADGPNGYHVQEDHKPLHVLVVGAGIGGLTAAAALRQCGHDVELFEQSKLAQETGAAIHLASNCNGLLRRMGLCVEDIGAVECVGVVEYLPHNNELKYAVDLSKASKMWQHPWHLVHRAHLHTALMRMATSEEGKGKPAKLHLASRVKHVDPEKATLALDDGTVVQGDLVVGADGVHSRTRSSIPGGDMKPFDSGKSAFRFLVPTEVLASDPQTAQAVSKSNYLTMWIGDDRRLIMYPCVNGTMMNFVAIHPSKESEADITGEGWQELGSKARMLQIYKGFAPSIRSILETADDSKLKVWKLLDMEKMPSFINGRMAVLGDAAHPFLPHQGQGGGQAIEDAVALAALLPLGTAPVEVPERLQLYEQCRYERAHKIQDFTRDAGKDAAELAAEGKTLNMMEYQAYNFGHDSWDNAKSVLRKDTYSRDNTLRFRNPLSFGASPGPRRPLGLLPSHSTIQSIRKSTPERFTTYNIRFRSSRTWLQNLLPKGFAFTSPGTVASASIKCTTLDGMTWLGGGGYNWVALCLHGINYTQRDGSKIYGSFLPVLFEDLTDPIITGRDELGFPKLYADIDVQQNDSAAGCAITLSWRGAVFGKFSIENLKPQPAVANGVQHAAPPRGPGPPPPPPEQGEFTYRYVPAVGEPGKADAEYAVFVPKPEPAAGAEQVETFVTQTATLKFEAGDMQRLPTLHHISSTLAEMPIIGIEEAQLMKGVGVSDLGGARRID